MADRRTDKPPLLETEGLSRSFGGLAAVRDVSLALHQGELQAVIGPNGAGKSTLVNLLSGELQPTAGRIHLQGRDVTGEPAWRMTHLGIGRSFQRTNILAPLTVIENVRLAVQAVRAPVRRLLQRVATGRDLVVHAEAILARVGLAGAGDRIAGTLAHGHQRQLEIAMALAAEPSVLLLDEPMAGMGPEESERMTLLLEDLARDHAVLLIEHDMDFGFAVADWMTVMVDGAVLAEGVPASIRANAAVQKAYLGVRHD
jgi:branched-chain amino acid transport system ATP-binding protein